MAKKLLDLVFHDANQQPVPYDGSSVQWRVSVYAVIARQDQVLIIKNSLEDLCDIVGGSIELGEDIGTALKRECLEEAGVQIEIGQLLDARVDWFYHRSGTFFQTLQLFYTANQLGELLELSQPEIEWRRFVPFSDIGSKYRLPPVVEQVVKKVASSYSN